MCAAAPCSFPLAPRIMLRLQLFGRIAPLRELGRVNLTESIAARPCDARGT